ncbi:MAG: PEP-CTERM sorting domain-containing protein [Tepidisphaeraceae bacterium]
MSANDLSAVNETVGNSGRGTFNQTGGTNYVSNGLNIGNNVGSNGTYELSAGLLSTGVESVNGSFVQSGGQNTVNGYLIVGDGLDHSGFGTGVYTLDNNQATLTVVDALEINVGSAGTFIQSAGSVTAGQVIVGLTGFPGGGTGQYILSGGTLATSSIGFGLDVTPGTLTQTGGSVTVGTQSSPGYINIGTQGGGGSPSSYSLSDSSGLSTLVLWGNMHVGYQYAADNFSQTGGSATINGDLTVESINAVAGVTFGGSAQCTVNGSVYVGGSSSAATGEGSFQQSNGSMTIGDVLKIWNSTATGATLSGGTLTVGSLNTSGTPANFNWSGGTLHLTGQPLNFTSGSDVDASFGSSLTLGSGQTRIVDNWEWLYGAGAYISQSTGGSNSCEGLYIGNTSGGSETYAVYYLDGGSLTSTGTPEYVGYAFSGGPGGKGYFYQYGGTNSTPELDVGYSSTGVTGEYDLYTGASLNVSGNEYIGYYSPGTFNQNGGTHTIGSNLFIGSATSGASGNFNLDGGTLSAANVYVGGSASPGVLALGNAALTVSGTLNVASTTGSYVFQAGGTLTAGSTVNAATFYEAAGVANLGPLSGAGSLTIAPSSPNGTTASMTVSALNQSSVTINSTGTLKVTGGSANAVNTLTINGGQLDLTNTHIFINYGGGPDPISAIAGYLASGYNGGTWNGPGIMSTAAQSNPSYGIGYADSADPGNPAGLAADQIEIKYTLLGDATLTGTVTGADFTILATHLGKSGIFAWDQGNFLYSPTGTITGADFTALVTNLGKTASGADVVLPASVYAAVDAFAAANGLMADVPEPTSFGLLGLAAAVVLARRRRSA